MSYSLPPLKLERYFAEYEFKVRYLLSASDCEALTMSELLDMADPASHELWNTLVLAYTESQGHTLLRDEVSRQYPPLSAGNVLILVPEEGILTVMNTMLESGDHIVVIAPSYQSLHEIARSRGVHVTDWPVRPSHEGWYLDIDELAVQIHERTRMIVVNFPHNPTGYLPSASEFNAMVELAARHGIYVFCDEMYRGLEYSSERRLTAACALAEYPRGISLSGMSKTYALPGLRIGWLATRDASLIHKWLTFKDYTTICSSAPSEILALMALRAREQIIRRNLGIIRTNITAMEQFCSKHPATVVWRAPDAGSVAWIEWKGKGSVASFCQAVLDRKGVMIVPGDMFETGSRYFRIGLGRRNFVGALHLVDEFLIESR
ncbi:MAG TPA: aminotransferase class I/II-fold pyridoxal phosphate-dependent enzyme [Anaerolineae bacterium]